MSERRYRALVGVPSLSVDGETKPRMRLGDRIPIQRMCIDEAMWHWDTRRIVDPYPLPRQSTPDADALARKLIRNRHGHFGTVPSAFDILNGWGASRHIAFLPERPEHGCDGDNRPFGRETGLLAYSVANPDGYYDRWELPITSKWNDVSVETCKLANTSYGTYHDMLYVADVAWFGTTFMPDVAFCAYRGDNGKIEYDELFRDDEDTKVWEHDLNTFYQQRLGLYGTIAMVECIC